MWILVVPASLAALVGLLTVSDVLERRFLRDSEGPSD
jgi:hypothetical protein